MEQTAAPPVASAKTKLRTRFVTLLAGTMVVCVAGLSFIWEPRIVKVMSAAQIENLDSKIEILSDSLVPYLLQNQFGAIFETLDSTKARNPHWLEVTLKSVDGSQIYPLFSSPHVEMLDTISTHETISFEGKKLAVLSVDVDISNELGQIRGQVRALTILMSLFFFSSLLVLGILFERWVVRRVTLLAAAAKQMSLGNYDASIPGKSNDEIGVLTDSFQFMRVTIRENQEKLIASRDEAQHAAEAKSRFLAMMSHEIRTPLNGILPTAEILLESDLKDEQRHLLSTIRDSGNSLKTIINDILDVSKLEEGKFDLRNEPFSPTSLAKSITGVFESAAKQKGIKLRTNIQHDPKMELLGDEGRLRQVLSNLVGNAIKFTSAGYIKLEIRTTQQNSDCINVDISVSDTGIGISPKDIGTIFERFSQVDNRSNREYQGSGLGLAICKQLVSAMGGNLLVESEIGRGSKFHFSINLPWAKSSLDQVAEEDHLQFLQAATAHVLVVDDNRTNLKVAQIILASLGHTVCIAENGYEAIEILNNENVDLVLLDVNMPGIDGYETTQRIRAESTNNPKVKILGHSASAFKEDKDRCINAGMDGFVAKPLSKRELFQEIQRLFPQEGAKTIAHSPGKTSA